MKTRTLIRIMAAAALTLSVCFGANAQLGKSILQRAKNSAETKAQMEADRAVSKALDKTIDAEKESAGNNELIEANGLRLDMVKAELSHNGKTCEATKNEIKILACLMRRQGAIVSRADLIEYLWDNQVYIDDNTLSVNMTRLRAKLDRLGLKDYIATRRGMGYRV